MVGRLAGEVLTLIDKHHDAGAFERAAALAWTQGQVQLHHLGIDRTEAGQFQRLAGHVIYAAPTLRPPSETIQAGAGGQPSLWSSASPVTCRSCWCGSPTSTSWTWCAKR